MFAIWDSSAFLAFLLSIIGCLEQCQCQKQHQHTMKTLSSSWLLLWAVSVVLAPEPLHTMAVQPGWASFSGCGSHGKNALLGCRFDARNHAWAMNISTQPSFAYNNPLKNILNFFPFPFTVWNINWVVSINNLLGVLNEETQQSQFLEIHRPTRHAHEVNA